MALYEATRRTVVEPTTSPLTMLTTLRRTLLVLPLIAAPLLAQGPRTISPVAAALSEEAAVRATVELYLQAHATGDGAYIERAFHPELKLVGVRNDSVLVRSGVDYARGFAGRPPADEARRRRWIASIDIFGQGATARVVLDYPQLTYVDFFTLLKIGGEWKIVSKVWTVEPK